MWAARYGSATDSQVSTFKDQVGYAHTLMSVFRWGGITVAVCGGIATAVFCVVALQRNVRAREVREANI